MNNISVKIVPIKKVNKEGLVPIYLQFIRNRKVNRLSLHQFIHTEACINTDGLFVKEKGPLAPSNAVTLNAYLSSTLNFAKEIILNAQKDREDISFRKFKDLLLNENNQSFISFCDAEMERREKLKKYSLETLRGNHSRLNKLRKFAPDLSFNDIDVNFLEDFEIHMRTDLGNDVNTVYGSMKFIRTMLNAAKKRDLTEVYPFDKYKIVFKKDTRERLSAEELDKLQDIYDSGILADNLQGVLTYFLFACYTGLTWKDVVNLDYEDIEKKGCTLLISKKRHKTEMRFTVPLIQKAKDLIDISQTEGQVFPNMLSNQKSNLYIQKIIKQSKIKKHISFHCSRHSFATIAMNSGVPREIVQQMLGHATEEQTKLYAKVLDKYIIEEMSKWDNNTNTVHFKEQLNDVVLTKYRKILIQIVATRITSGMSEAQMARVLGVSIAKYSEIEKGNVQLGVADMFAVGEVLDLDISGLF